MKKKILSIIMLVSVVVGGCDSTSNSFNANEVYPNALQDFYNLESYKADFTSTFTLYNPNSDNPENVSYYTLEEIRKDNNEKLGMLTQDISYEGEEYISNCLYIDGFAYYYGFSDPLKMEMDYDEFKSQYTYDGIMDIDGITPTDINLGNKTVSFEISEESSIVADIVAPDIEYLYASFSENFEEDDTITYNVSPFIYTVTFDKNNQIDKTETTYSITLMFDNDRSDVQFNFKVEMDIVETNNVEIEIPTNLDEFELFDPTVELE